MSVSALSGSTVLHLNPSDTGAGAPPPARAAKANVVGEAAAPQERASDPVTEVIKQLQERLRQVMLQIRRLQASRIPEEQKLPQLRVLNSQAVQLQQQIAAAQEQKLRAARGGITA